METLRRQLLSTRNACDAALCAIHKDALTSVNSACEKSSGASSDYDAIFLPNSIDGARRICRNNIQLEKLQEDISAYFYAEQEKGRTITRMETNLI